MLAVLLVVLNSFAQTPEPTPEQMAFGSAFQSAMASQDWGAAFDNLEALAKSVQEVEPAGAEQLRGILIPICFDGLREDSSDDRLTDAWLDRADRLVPPTDPADVNWTLYGVNKAFLAAGRFNQGRKGEARVAYNEARHFISTGTSTEVSPEAAKGMIDYVGQQLDPAPGVGDYVTHAGGITQKWIGKIVATDAEGYTVRLTYSAGAQYGGVGSDIYVARKDVTFLKAISVDAVIKGWR